MITVRCQVAEHKPLIHAFILYDSQIHYSPCLLILFLDSDFNNRGLMFQYRPRIPNLCWDAWVFYLVGESATFYIEPDMGLRAQGEQVHTGVKPRSTISIESDTLLHVICRHVICRHRCKCSYTTALPFSWASAAWMITQGIDIQGSRDQNTAREDDPKICRDLAVCYYYLKFNRPSNPRGLRFKRYI